MKGSEAQFMGGGGEQDSAEQKNIFEYDKLKDRADIMKKEIFDNMIYNKNVVNAGVMKSTYETLFFAKEDETEKR
jgi:pyruvate-formate lyase